MDWFIERLNQESPTLDYYDLRNHADDCTKLIDLRIIKHSDNIESIPCDLCDVDHFVSPFRNGKGELVISCSGSRRVVNPDELKIWTIIGEVLVKNVNSKNHVINKKQFAQTAFALNPASAKKDSDIKVPIRLTIGVEIRGKQATKGYKKFELNSADQALIYFLYYKFLENKGTRFKIAMLAETITSDGKKLSGNYLKNRITIINKGIKKLVTEGVTSIPALIKNEERQGYHLNPKLFPAKK